MSHHSASDAGCTDSPSMPSLCGSSVGADERLVCYLCMEGGTLTKMYKGFPFHGKCFDAGDSF